MLLKSRLGPNGQGYMYPMKTYLKKDRKGFGNNNGEKSKINHFQPHDTSAMHNVQSIQKRSRTHPNEKILARKEQKQREMARLWEMELRKAPSLIKDEDMLF